MTFMPQIVPQIVKHKCLATPLLCLLCWVLWPAGNALAQAQPSGLYPAMPHAKADSVLARLAPLPRNAQYADTLCALAMQVPTHQVAYRVALATHGAHAAHLLQDSLAEVQCLQLLAEEKTQLADIRGSLALCFYMLQLLQHYPQHLAKAQVLHKIAQNHAERGEHMKSIEWLRKAQAANRHSQPPNPEMDFMLAMALGRTYTRMGHQQPALLDSAQHFLQEALHMARKQQSEAFEGMAILYQAELCEAQDQMDEAISLHQQSMAIHQRLNRPRYWVWDLHCLGLAYQAKGNLGQAQGYFEEALAIGRQAQQPLLLYWVLQDYAKVQQQLGQPAEAYAALEEYMAIKDSLVNQKQTRAITRMELNYQFQQERDSVALAQAALNMSHAQQLARQQVLQQVTLGGLFAGLVLAAIFFRLYRQKQTANKTLQLLNGEVNAQNEEIAQQRDQLDGSLQHIQELTRFKGLMVDMVAHDLKNPLNTVIGLAELPANAERLHLIKHSSRRMLRLVHNMLDVHRLEDTQLTLKKALQPIPALLAEAVEQVSLQLEEKGLQLSQAAPPYQLMADGELLCRVLVNLLHNAAKYTPKGGAITLAVSQHEENQLRIAVSDTGPGIAPEEQPHIFDPYYQAGSNHKKGSTGLGLAFCRQVIAAHQGQIGVASALGQGTTFWFTMPWQGQMQAPQPSQALAAPAAGKALSAAAYNALHPLLPKLQGLQAHQITDVKAVLNTLDAPQDPALAQWKAALTNALFACDNHTYQHMVQEEYFEVTQESSPRKPVTALK